MNSLNLFVFWIFRQEKRFYTWFQLNNVKILVFGAGALGSLMGGLLSNKNQVTLIGRKKHVEAVNSNGLIIEGKTKMVAETRALENVPDEEFDLIVFTVKSYDTSKAIKSLVPLLKRNTTILSLQNGIGNIEEISQHGKSIIGGVTSHGVTHVGPGKISHNGTGYTTIGNISDVDTAEVKKISQIFNDAGVETRISDNIEGEIWAKAIINASINPLTAITRLTNRHLVEVNGLEEIMVSACREATKVSSSNNIDLPSYDMVEKTKMVARKTGENKSSMYQDIEKGRRTEIDSITGVFVEMGERTKDPTPVNSLLFNLVKNIEGYQKSRNQKIDIGEGIY
jgi:2-dehydropantoate 2-reductase